MSMLPCVRSHVAVKQLNWQTKSECIMEETKVAADKASQF